ncbi:MAG: glycosyltransferase family 1 protein, partial [Thermoguttaceae bacterium]
MMLPASCEAPETAATTHADLPLCTGPRVRVLHVINGEVYGGAERALDHLARHLGRFGFDVTMAC